MKFFTKLVWLGKKIKIHNGIYNTNVKIIKLLTIISNKIFSCNTENYLL